MIIEQVSALDNDALLESEYDVVVAASGFEQRASYLATALKTRAPRRYALGFEDRLVRHRTNNDAVFEQLGYSLLQVPGGSGNPVWNIVKEHLRGSSAGPLRVLVDYSSMTRVWYAGLIAELRHATVNRDVQVTFSYTPATFTPPQPPSPNKVMAPIDGFAGLQSPSKNTALVIGLGYEAHRAIGLVQYIEPAQTYAFLTKPAMDPRYTDQALRASSALIDALPHEHVITYPLKDLRITAAKLSSLCLGLRNEFRVIIAPLGPKPFTLLSLLLASKHYGIDVWRVSSGETGATYDRPPLGEVLGCVVMYCAGSARESEHKASHLAWST